MTRVCNKNRDIISLVLEAWPWPRGFSRTSFEGLVLGLGNADLGLCLGLEKSLGLGFGLGN